MAEPCCQLKIPENIIDASNCYIVSCYRFFSGYGVEFEAK